MLRSGVNYVYRHSGAHLKPITYFSVSFVVLLDDNSLLASTSSGEHDDNTSLSHTTQQNQISFEQINATTYIFGILMKTLINIKLSLIAYKSVLRLN
jgi:hypothetical protein